MIVFGGGEPIDSGQYRYDVAFQAAFGLYRRPLGCALFEFHQGRPPLVERAIETRRALALDVNSLISGISDVSISSSDIAASASNSAYLAQASVQYA